jgi:hypothetical protein
MVVSCGISTAYSNFFAASNLGFRAISTVHFHDLLDLLLAGRSIVVDFAQGRLYAEQPCCSSFRKSEAGRGPLVIEGF